MSKAARMFTPLLASTAALCLLLCACGSGEGQADQAQETGGFIASEVAADKARLADNIEPLFNGDLPGQTRALIIMHKGEIVAERYGAGFDDKTPLIGWSLSKSVTAVLIGILVTDGRLSLDAPAPVPAWSSPGDERGKITIRQLLNMSSSLSHNEGIGLDNAPPYENDASRMLFLEGAQDMATFAERRPLETAPGSHFEYSTGSSIILSDIIARALTPSEDAATRQKSVQEFAEGRLFAPLGLESMRAEYDASGTMVGGAYIHATARDWAKFGEFLRNNGAVSGAQIVPSSWLKFMAAPAPQNAAYGGHIWRNVSPTNGHNSPLFPGMAPASALGMLGHYGQLIIVSPQQKLTIVRLGMTEEEETPLITEQIGRITALFPSS